MHIYRPQEWVWNADSLTTRLGVKCMHIDCKNGCEKTAHIHFLVDMCFYNLGILINLHSCHLMPLKPGTFSCPKTSQMCNKTVQTGDSWLSLCLLSSSDEGTLFFLCRCCGSFKRRRYGRQGLQTWWIVHSAVLPPSCLTPMTVCSAAWTPSVWKTPAGERVAVCEMSVTLSSPNKAPPKKLICAYSCTRTSNSLCSLCRLLCVKFTV